MIKYFRLLLFVILITNFIGIIYSQDAKSYYDTAKSLYIAGDNEGALKQLEKALEIDPNYEPAKKLRDKIGVAKPQSKSGKFESKQGEIGETQSSQQPSIYLNIQPNQYLQRENLHNNISLFMSNLISESRSEIFIILSEVIKQSFVETMRGESYSLIKDQIKNIVKEIVKDIIENEINFAISSIKEFTTNEYTNTYKFDNINLSKYKENNYENNMPKEKQENIQYKKPENENKAIAIEYYNKALKLLDEEEYSEAKKLIELANKLDPENTEIENTMKRLSSIK